MSMFYKVSDKQLLKDRNELFKEVGISALENNNFVRSIFSTSWNGEYDRSIRGYSYEFYRLISNRYLERVDVSIMSGEKWVQIYLNIFELTPELKSLTELNPSCS